MGRYGAVIAVLALASGCRQILGIDDPSLDERVPVTGRVRVRSTTLSSDGSVTPLERAYADAELSVTAWLADGSSSMVEMTGEGTFTFLRESETQPYRVRVKTPQGEVEYQHTAAHLEISDRLEGRESQQVPASNTRLKFSIEGGAPMAPMQVVMSTGVWTSTSVAAFSPTVELEWSSVSASPRDLLNAERGDRVYYGVYRSESGAPAEDGSYSYLDQLSSQAVTLVNGVGKSFTMPAPISPNRGFCAQVNANKSSATARLRAAAPQFANATGGSAATIFTIPHISSAVTQQLLLAFDSGPADTRTIMRFSSPFPGQVMIGMQTSLARAGNAADGEMTTSIGAAQFEPLAIGNMCPTKVLEPIVGLAGNPTIAGTTLVSERAQLSLPDGPVEVTWNDAVAGKVDYYIIGIQDLYAKSAPFVRRVITTDRRAMFDRDLFRPGTVYVVQLVTVYGQPGAASGDFDTREDAFGIASIVSPTFLPGS